MHIFSLSFESLIHAAGGYGRAKQLVANLRVGGAVLEGVSKRVQERLGKHGIETDATKVGVLATTQESTCGTCKFSLALADGAQVEMVLIPGRGRTTLCISSQVGCARQCGFCMTATMGLRRQLSVDEIICQLYWARHETLARGLPALRNIVFMGMGEPLDNLQSLRQALALFVDDNLWAVAPRYITVSTVGTSPARILGLEDLPGRLAWSVHSARPEVRHRLVPTDRHDLQALRDAFVKLMQQRRQDLFVEMAMMAGVNDHLEEAKALYEFLAPFGPGVRVNLIPMNPGREGLEPAQDQSLRDFAAFLRERGMICTVRTPRGTDDAAACGQLLTTLPRSGRLGKGLGESLGTTLIP